MKCFEEKLCFLSIGRGKNPERSFPLWDYKDTQSVPLRLLKTHMNLYRIGIGIAIGIGINILLLELVHCYWN